MNNIKEKCKSYFENIKKGKNPFIKLVLPGDFEQYVAVSFLPGKKGSI